VLPGALLCEYDVDTLGSVPSSSFRDSREVASANSCRFVAGSLTHQGRCSDAGDRYSMDTPIDDLAGPVRGRLVKELYKPRDLD
jgi:hypothetical protein